MSFPQSSMYVISIESKLAYPFALIKQFSLFGRSHHAF